MHHVLRILPSNKQKRRRQWLLIYFLCSPKFIKLIIGFEGPVYLGEEKTQRWMPSLQQHKKSKKRKEKREKTIEILYVHMMNGSMNSFFFFCYSIWFEWLWRFLFKDKAERTMFTNQNSMNSHKNEVKAPARMKWIEGAARWMK